MKKVTAILIAVSMSLMVAAVSFASEKEGYGTFGSGEPSYKAVPKAMHEYAFPEGHPATESWLNHCYWVEEENLLEDNRWLQIRSFLKAGKIMNSSMPVVARS